MANESFFGSKVIFLGDTPITLPILTSDPVTFAAGDFYYNSTANEIRYYNGTSWDSVASGGSGANQQLSNLSGAIAVNLDLNPDTNGTLDIGSASFSWKDIYASKLTADSAQLVLDGTSISASSKQINNLANGTLSTDAVNYGQLQAVSNGQIWLDPLQDPDLVDDSLMSPPGSPISNTTYIAAATAGAWTAGHVYYYDFNTLTWVDILGRAIVVGDRFGITLEHGSGSEGGSMVGNHGNIFEVDSIISPGSYTYTITSPTTYDTVFVNNSLSQHFSHSYNYNGTSWVEIAGPGVIIPGSALAFSGNTLNVQYDNSTIDLATNQLKIKTNGITNTHISNSASIAYSKLDTLTSGNILVGSVGNVATSVTMSSEATIIASGAVTLSNAAVIAKVLTGYVSGAGSVSATDSILSAIQKLNGNIGVISGSSITALTGDATATGPGSATLTLTTVNSNTGSFGSSTSIPSFTVNAKGLITAASSSAVIAPAGTLSGTTLNATVVSSSLTSLGTITSGIWNGTTIDIANGGTNATTASAARSNLGLIIGTDVQAYDAQLSSLVRQNSQSAAYTTVLTDGGKHILHPSADTTARTFTIDSNANVAYPIGTAITFVNQDGAGIVTIAITSDTMRLAGAGTTGSRTLAANGVATALKVTSTEWIISGSGLT